MLTCALTNTDQKYCVHFSCVLFQQNEMIKKLVYDKGELLEKHSETQGHYDMQIEALKNMVRIPFHFSHF